MVKLREWGWFAADIASWAWNILWSPPEIYPPLNGYGALTGDQSDTPTPVISQPVSPAVQWGLRLPNGTIVWDNCLYQGHPLATPEQRAVLLAVLQKTAADLSFDEQEFIGHYGWARRIGVPTVAYGDVTVIPLGVTDSEQGGDPQLSADRSENLSPEDESLSRT